MKRRGRCPHPLALVAAATAFISFYGVDAALTSTNIDGCGSRLCNACEGDCDTDADCAGSLVCSFRSAGSTAAIPSCGSGGLGGWDYCIAPSTPTPAPPTAAKPTLGRLYSTSIHGCGGLGYLCNKCEGDCDSDRDCAGSLVCYQRVGHEAIPECGNGIGNGGMLGETSLEAADRHHLIAIFAVVRPFQEPAIIYALFLTLLFASLLVPLVDWDYCGVAYNLPPCNLSIPASIRPKCKLPPCNTSIPKNQQGECEWTITTSSILASTGTCPSGGCEECEGLCHSDSDCAGNLECFKRDGLEQVPGCGSGGKEGWNYCTKALPLCDLSLPPASRPLCKIFKPPCDMDVPLYAQPPCEKPPTPVPTQRPTTPIPTATPTLPPPPTTSRPTPTPPPPTALPVCDLSVAPWNRPPCRLVLSPCNPLIPQSQQTACQVRETAVPTRAPTTSAPTAAPTASLLVSTGSDGCGSGGCEECEGQCEFDSDCAGDLVCFQRKALEHVRGCGSGGREGWDYCAKPLPPCDGFPEEAACTDRDQRCASWASGGECQRNPPYMNASCARSCARCSPTPRPPCSTAAPTLAPTSSPTGQLPLCDMAKAPWERPRCVEPLPPCNSSMQLWEQAPCTPHWSEPLRPGEKPVLPSK